jgi:hypothetical protein
MARVALPAVALLSVGGALACVPPDGAPVSWGGGPDTGVVTPTPDAGVAAEDLASRAAACTRPFVRNYGDLPSAISSGGRFRATDVPFAASSFVVDFFVTLEGDVTFFPAAPDEMTGGLPSITRSGSELILGTWTYGADPELVAGRLFSGQRLPVDQVHVTVFVEADGSRLAMRVESGGASFWSGYTTTSPAPHGLLLAAEAPSEVPSD